MKKILLSAMFFLFFLVSFQIYTQGQEDTALTNYLRRNVSFIDVRVRALNQDYYVKDILVVDFLQTSSIPDSMSFLGVPLTDDGTGFDLTAGDGFYTSIDSFQLENYSETDPLVKSVYDKAIIDSTFAWPDELDNYLSNYNPPGAGEKWIIRMTCNVMWCTCSNPNCNHCEGQYYMHWVCFPCPNFSGCTISIAWEW